MYVLRAPHDLYSVNKKDIYLTTKGDSNKLERKGQHSGLLSA